MDDLDLHRLLNFLRRDRSLRRRRRRRECQSVCVGLQGASALLVFMARNIGGSRTLGDAAPLETEGRLCALFGDLRMLRGKV